MKRGRESGSSRREFLRESAALAALAAGYGAVYGQEARGGDAAASRPAVVLHADPADAIANSPAAQWAMGELAAALEAKKVAVRRAPLSAFPTAGAISIAVVNVKHAILDSLLIKHLVQRPTAPESFALLPINQSILLATAPDARGLVYALTELADRVNYAPSDEVVRAIQLKEDILEKPAAGIRSIFRMFVSEVEDKRWFYDREGWQKYFDMLAANRFNRFNLSFGLSYDFSNGLSDTYTFFMYPFFVDVPGYNVRAVARGGKALAAEEMAKNLETLKFISDQAALRGLDFNLGIWTHSYRWAASPNATHTIEGLNAQTQAPYSRDAMKMLLEACPGITGVTLRTHGESGVPEGSYDIWKVIMSGITGHKKADGSPRVIELDLHGKTMTKEMIDTALGTGMPLTISCKFWAEHMGLPYVQASIREAEMPKGRDAGGLMALSNGSRSFLRYGIGDLLQKDRRYKVIHRVWPGTQRLLLWGDPLYAAEYGRVATFAGMDGIDYFEPLSFRGRAGSSMNLAGGAEHDRSGYADALLRAEHDWEKYTYTFRLWGRLSYNPDAKADTWQRQLTSEFGEGSAVHLEAALANASRILPLITTAHDPSAANFQYWPEMYVNQSLLNPSTLYTEAPQPRIFGNVSSLDPQLFASVSEYVVALLAVKPLAKISPLDVARQLDTWSNASVVDHLVGNGMLNGTDAFQSPFRRLTADIAILSGIGSFFAHKFRAAIFWQLFNLSAHEPARAAASDAYKKARDAWAKLAEAGKVYAADLTFGPERQLRRHWSDRLADIDADIAALATRAANPRNADYPKETIDKLIQSITNPVQADIEGAPVPQHTPPANFKAGDAVRLWVGGPVNGGILHYRHLHQGERYTALPLAKEDAGLVATIPAAFTKSAFPLQYYFEVHRGEETILYPGFKANFIGQPYYIIQPA